MIIGLLTDTHHGARNDSLPMQAAMAKFYRETVFPTLREHQVTRVVHLGDFGDRRKYVNGATARFVSDVYDLPMQELGITQDILLGNHDIYYRNTTDVSLVEEFYRHAGDRVRVHSVPTEVHIDGCDILFLPWIVENNRAASLDRIANSRCPVVMGHLEISGFQMYRGIANHEGLTADMFERFEAVYTGHFHHKSSNGPVQYLGAMWPMTWTDYNDVRGFHLFDTQSHALTYIQNPHSLFVKVFYDDKGKTHDYIRDLVQEILAPGSPHHDAYVKVITRSKEQPYWFDLMMDSLYKVNAQDVLVIDDIIVNDEDEVDCDEASPDVDTLTLMREFVESLSISCDKNELFAYLQTKYHDALAASQSARLL